MHARMQLQEEYISLLIARILVLICIHVCMYVLIGAFILSCNSGHVGENHLSIILNNVNELKYLLHNEQCLHVCVQTGNE
jgi:hypothetical protein